MITAMNMTMMMRIYLKRKFPGNDFVVDISAFEWYPCTVLWCKVITFDISNKTGECQGLSLSDPSNSGPVARRTVARVVSSAELVPYLSD
jgi:hypothetical protein